MRQPNRGLLAERALWQAHGARLLAFGGAALFAIAAWAPWITGAISFSLGEPGAPGAPTGTILYSYDSSLGVYLLLAKLLRNGAASDPETASRVISFAWGGVTALGILITPLLWQRLGLRLRRVPFYAFAVWLAVAAIATLTLAIAIWHYNPTSPDFTIAITTRHIGLGLWLALLGLASASLGLLLIYRERQSSEPVILAPPSPPTSPARRWAILGLFSVGVACWLFGFLAIPWVEVNCTSLQITLNHLTSGACGELDSADALSPQFAEHISTSLWNISEGLYPLYGALIGGALLLLVAVWSHPTSRIVTRWAAAWLAAASLTAYLAYRGVGSVITSGPALTTEAQGAWNGATGIAVTLFGLLLAWLAILPMEGARWWSLGATVPPPQPDLDPFATSGDEFEVTRLSI